MTRFVNPFSQLTASYRLHHSVTPKSQPNFNLPSSTTPYNSSPSPTLSPIGNRNHGALRPSRTDSFLRGSNPSFSFGAPRNLLWRPGRIPQAPGPQFLKIHLQDLRANVPSGPPPHPNRLRTAFRFRAPLSDHSCMGNHLPCCIILDWNCSALLAGHAGLDYGCYYV